MKPKINKRYTNESLSKKFNNNFDLVNYAISLAENMIHSGRAPQVKIDNENLAMATLAEIDAGKDIFVPIEEGKVVRQQPSSFDDEQLKRLMKEERSEGRKHKGAEIA